MHIEGKILVLIDVHLNYQTLIPICSMLTREELEEKVAKAVIDHFPLVLFPSLWSMWMRCDNCIGSHVDKLPVASSPLWKRNDHIFHTCMRKHNQNITHLLCIQDGLIYHRMIDPCSTVIQ